MQFECFGRWNGDSGAVDNGQDPTRFAADRLNVFIRSLDQIRLRMTLPGFCFERQHEAMKRRIGGYGGMVDVEKAVNHRLAQWPQHSESGMDLVVEKAHFVNEITQRFEERSEVFKFESARKMVMEVSVRRNPERVIEVAKRFHTHRRGDSDDDDDDDDDNDCGNELMHDSRLKADSVVVIERALEMELQIARRPVPQREAVKKRMAARKRCDSFDSEEENEEAIALSTVDTTLLDWISLGWKRIKCHRLDANYDLEDAEVIRESIDIAVSEEWWKSHRDRLMTAVDLNDDEGRWLSRHATASQEDEVICNDLVMRCRSRDRVFISMKNRLESLEHQSSATAIPSDEVVVSQSTFCPISAVTYDLRLPPGLFVYAPLVHFDWLPLY